MTGEASIQSLAGNGIEGLPLDVAPHLLYGAVNAEAIFAGLVGAGGGERLAAATMATDNDAMQRAWNSPGSRLKTLPIGRGLGRRETPSS